MLDHLAQIAGYLVAVNSQSPDRNWRPKDYRVPYQARPVGPAAAPDPLDEELSEGEWKARKLRLAGQGLAARHGFGGGSGPNGEAS